MSKQILETVERKDINLAKRMEDKLPKEYTTFRDSILETLRGMEELNCKTYIPQFYTMLCQAGFTPEQARAVVLKDGIELFHWSPITINRAISSVDTTPFDQKKRAAGQKSALVKKVRKQAERIVDAAVDESRRGPGRPRNPPKEFKAVVDVDEFEKDWKEYSARAKKATNKIELSISEEGKLTMSVYLVSGGPEQVATTS